MSTITAPHVVPLGVRRSQSRRQSSPTVRLTRRGRAVVLLLGLAIALAVGVFLGAGSVATEHPGTPAPTRIVMVDSGDTLWDIAADAAAATGSDDVREMVTRIERLNALESGMVLAGQRLRVPTE
jgi:LysM domain-containing protein